MEVSTFIQHIHQSGKPDKEKLQALRHLQDRTMRDLRRINDAIQTVGKRLNEKGHHF